MADMLPGSGGETRVGQIVALVRGRIERRVLLPGARLPSVRAMAETTGFSKSTVVEAYDRLAAEGVIRARPGSGFFVAAPLAPLAVADVEQAPRRDIDPVWMLRRSIEDLPGAIRAGSGTLPTDWLAGEAMRKAMRAAARGNTLPSADVSVLGYGPMRALLSRRMLEQGVEASPDQILLTESGTHSLDLVCRFLLQPGDTVLLDDPCFFNFLALLRAHRARVVAVPMTPQGPDLAAFAEVVAREKPRLYITNSAVHNPTGATLSATHAHRVLKIAEAADMLIVEDDIFCDFEHVTASRYAAFDGLDRVIRIGSFSKTATNALRCGHVALRADWVESLADLRLVTTYVGNPLGAELLAAMVTDGSYRHHMDMVRNRLARAMARVVRRLGDLGLEPWTVPACGMSLWVPLPGGLDASVLAGEALEEGIVLAPGAVFSPRGGWNDHVRLNVTQCDDPRFYAFLARMCAS
ncbi:PLP-dependent aminotransferase family protein [Novosphingobium nitrogenifigens]